MTPTDIAALATAIAGLATAGVQWFRLFGLPGSRRRNGHHAWLRYLEARLAAAEHALDECLQRQRPQPPTPARHRTQPARWTAIARPERTPPHA